MDIVDQKIDDTRNLLVQQYGFAADPDLLLWKNMEIHLTRMDVHEVESRPRNMACHDLLQRLKLPTGTKELLGLNLNFCVKPASTSEMTKMTFKRLKSDLRRMWALKDAINDGNYMCVCNLATEGVKVFANDGSIEITGQCSPPT